MVFIIEGCGLSCIAFAYITLLLSNITFIKVGVVYNLSESDNKGLTYLNLLLYEVVIFMIIWSHLKTMLSEPGYIPIGQREYNIKLLPSKVK